VTYVPCIMLSSGSHGRGELAGVWPLMMWVEMVAAVLMAAVL
jgi:hypothetical protein